MTKRFLNYYQGDGNEGKFLVLVDSQGNGVLLSSGKLHGKIVCIRILSRKLTEIPFVDVRKKVFNKPISKFKFELATALAAAIKNPDKDLTGSFPIDDIKTMVIGSRDLEGMQPFTGKKFQEIFFTDPKEVAVVDMPQNDSGDNTSSFHVCRGSTDLHALIKTYRLGYKILRFDWGFDL